MNGLINRAIALFMRDSYGEALWKEIVTALDAGEAAFEPLMPCDPAVTCALIAASAARLARAPEDLLEDLGTYLVSHPRAEAVRRLLRFGGVDFADFLHSLEDLPGRARLAMADLDLPEIRLHAQGPGRYRVEVGLRAADDLRVGPVLIGVLRAMADDYGALVLLDHRGCDGRREMIEVRLLDAAHADGRAFDLGAGQVAR